AAGAPASDVGFWADALARQFRFLREELALLSPATALSAIPTLRELAAIESQDASAAARPATERMALIERLALDCDELARMKYDFLYDRARHLLAIGYNVTEGRLDSGCYDLLASEARFASFVAISQGELPQES